MTKKDLAKIAKHEGLPCPHILSKRDLVSVLDSWGKMKKAKDLVIDCIIKQSSLLYKR